MRVIASASEPADPERSLVLAYADSAARDPLGLLWRLDERLGQVVAAARESALAEIRLAWWREALERLDAGPAPAEPLLAEIAAILLPAGLNGAGLGVLADGWAALLSVPLDAAALGRFARERGGPLFAMAGRLLGGGGEEVIEAGEGWALVDFAHRGRDRLARTAALSVADEKMRSLRISRWPGRLRPLAALALLARSDARKRRAEVRPASPSRVARLALAGLTGR